jgi:5'-deoxynucleotidase YfbR-like HD superfamily hydrolase
MIVNSSILDVLFRSYHIQRWNDRVRPMNMIEMDKHAHKMIIAYCLGKYEEMDGNEIDWMDMIRRGIYELMRRIVLSDIKSPIYTEIKKNKKVFRELNKFVYNKLKPNIGDETVLKEFEEFLFEEGEETLTRRVLDAAHIYSSYWEFEIIKISNPFVHQNDRISKDLQNRVDSYQDLYGIRNIVSRKSIVNFIDLCGQLRFQIRWAQTPRVPETSVLGHSLLVAIIGYLFSRDNNACDKRLYNNFFGGLFHDLPEAVTRDIISPVKKGNPEFDDLVKILEKSLTDEEIFPHIEKEWIEEIEYYLTDEFHNKIIVNGKIQSKDITTDIINEKYNTDEFSPYDGQIIRAADKLAAFLEAYNSCSSGIKSEELTGAMAAIKEKYMKQKLGKVSIDSLYASFKTNF